MDMGFLSRMFKKRPEFDVVYHVGTSSVGVGVVELTQDALPKVVRSVRESIPYREDVVSERFVTDMLDTLKRTNERLVKNLGPIHIKHAYYIFSSPWVATQTKTVTIKEKKPFTLTKGLVEKTVASYGPKEIDNKLSILEKKVVDIKLNGYPLADPYGKKATTADISIFLSYIPKDLFKKVVDMAHSTYHAKDTKAFSCALASFSAIRDSFHEENDFMFLDIGGELSDLTIVKGGLIIETGSFPLGGHFLIRALKTALSISTEEAVSLARIYEEGTVEHSFEQKLKPVMDQTSIDWARRFHVALTKISNGTILPMKLFVVIHNDFENFFTRALGEGLTSISETSMVPMSVTFVAPDALKSSVVFDSSVEKDPFIAIVSAFVGKLYESGAR